MTISLHSRRFASVVIGAVTRGQGVMILSHAGTLPMLLLAQRWARGDNLDPGMLPMLNIR